MKFIANVLWFIFGGLVSFLLYTIIGVVLCITIIGIPFGLQFFKLGQLMLAPFGKEVVYGGKGGSFIMNMLWLILFGWETALFSVILGIIYCITIIGIPVGIQVIKFAKLALMPFGTEIRKKTKEPNKKAAETPTEQPTEQPAEPAAEEPTPTEASAEPTPAPAPTPAPEPAPAAPVPEPAPTPEIPAAPAEPIAPPETPPVQPEPPVTPPTTPTV